MTDDELPGPPGWYVIERPHEDPAFVASGPHDTAEKASTAASIQAGQGTIMHTPALLNAIKNEGYNVRWSESATKPDSLNDPEMATDGGETGDLIRRGADKCDLDLDLVVSLPIPENDQVWFIEHRSNWQDEGSHYLLWRYEEVPDPDGGHHEETHMLELPQGYATALSSLTHAAQLHAVMMATGGYSPLVGDDGTLDLRTVAENFDLSNELGENTTFRTDFSEVAENFDAKEDGDDE